MSPSTFCTSVPPSVNRRVTPTSESHVDEGTWLASSHQYLCLQLSPRLSIDASILIRSLLTTRARNQGMQEKCRHGVKALSHKERVATVMMGQWAQQPATGHRLPINLKEQGPGLSPGRTQERGHRSPGPKASCLPSSFTYCSDPLSCPTPLLQVRSQRAWKQGKQTNLRDTTQPNPQQKF